MHFCISKFSWTNFHYFLMLLHVCSLISLYLFYFLPLCFITSVSLFSSLPVSPPGGDPSSGADFCQSNIQFFPGHAALLLSVSGSLTGLFPSTACHPADSVHTSTHSDSCGRPAGDSGSAVFYTVRY